MFFEEKCVELSLQLNRFPRRGNLISYLRLSGLDGRELLLRESDGVLCGPDVGLRPLFGEGNEPILRGAQGLERGPLGFQ